MKDCYAEYVLDGVRIELLGVPLERYETCEPVEFGRVVVSGDEGKRCVEDYCYAYYV